MSSYKLTSTKKNEDVIKILDEVNKKEGIKVTDYICNAIRFFERYKDLNIEKINTFYEKNKDFDFNNNLNYTMIQDVVDGMFKRKLSEIGNIIETESSTVNNNNNSSDEDIKEIEDEITITNDKDLEIIDDDWIDVDED